MLISDSRCPPAFSLRLKNCFILILCDDPISIIRYCALLVEQPLGCLYRAAITIMGVTYILVLQDYYELFINVS